MATNFVRNGVGDANTKSKGWIGIAIAIMVIIAIVMVVKALYNASKDGGLLLGEELGKQIIAAQTGIEPARQSVCKDVANNVWLNGIQIYKPVALFGLHIAGVNDDVVVKNLNRLLTQQEVALSSLYFKNLSGFNYSWVIDDKFFWSKNKLNAVITQNAI